MPGDLELLRRLTVAFNRGDLVTLRESYAPDIRVVAGELWPTAGPVVGVDRVLAEFASILATFEHVEVIAEDYIRRGDAIVVPSRWCGTIAGSDSVIESRVVPVYRLRDGQVASIDYFTSMEEALGATETGPARPPRKRKRREKSKA